MQVCSRLTGNRPSRKVGYENCNSAPASFAPSQAAEKGVGFRNSQVPGPAQIEQSVTRENDHAGDDGMSGDQELQRIGKSRREKRLCSKA